ncbi:DUF1992 domain-containing protein [Paenibacillus thailandensis]|uniref:DUF1992 domain-containing protein n=1 Tax=Paenibacillus thailandensis TaxID=393250 RepID=A0ABW5QW22_9BACL
MSNGEENGSKPLEPYKSYSQWVDEAVEEFAKKGGFDDLPGKGKPLHIAQGDAFSGVLKEAHYLPAWVELRKEIAKDMERYIDKAGHLTEQEGERAIGAINEKIRKYNRMVPSGTLQRGLVTSENIRSKYEYWR